MRSRSCESLLDSMLEYYPSARGRKRVFLVRPKYDYGSVRRGLSFEENNFLHSLVHSGYEVIAFDPLEGKSRFGKRRMNELLLEGVFRWNPDVVFFILFKDEIDTATLRLIRDQMKITTCNWFCDDHWRFDSFSQHYAPHFSFVVTTDRAAVTKYYEIGYRNVLLSQWACNHFLYRYLDLPYQYDVTFVGQPHGSRMKMVDRLRAAGVEVHTFGYGWPNGRISTREMITIFNQTKVNLNLSNASTGRINQIKARDFEIPGCGGFMITGFNDALNEYYEISKEVVCYAQPDELVELVKYYLENDEEREQIREAGYQRVIRCHTYAHRFEEIFSALRESSGQRTGERRNENSVHG